MKNCLGHAMQDAVMIRSLAGTMLVMALLVGLLLLAGCETDPLMLAAARRDTAGVLVLLDQGAGVNRQGHWNRTALHYAAESGHVETAKALLDRGADPNAKGSSWTPLHYAAWKGHEQLVRLLLQAGADPKAVENDGRTPAIMAKQYEHTAVGSPVGSRKWERWDFGGTATARKSAGDHAPADLLSREKV